MDEVLVIINESFDELLTLRRQRRVKALRDQLGEIHNELDILTHRIAEER